jgi:hypothetical protein
LIEDEMPPAKHRTPVVPAKVKVALDLLFNDPNADLASAAVAVGMPTNRLRDQLKLPHVRRYATLERGAFIDSLCAGNPAALKDIRDKSLNSMARVAAIRQAEQMKADLDNPASGMLQQRHSPGLVVQIVNVAGEVTQTIGPPAPQPVIDVTPLSERAKVDLPGRWADRGPGGCASHTQVIQPFRGMSHDPHVNERICSRGVAAQSARRRDTLHARGLL